jgi:carbonyl reductase 1
VILSSKIFVLLNFKKQKFFFCRKAKQNSHEDDGYPNSAYGMSKIALIAATIIQQRVFDDKRNKDIVVNACCPGFINTDMTSNKGTGTPEQGADTPVYLATLEPNIKSPRGEFVAERKILKWKC